MPDDKPPKGEALPPEDGVPPLTDADLAGTRDDPLRFYREYGLNKVITDELARTSLTAQLWVRDLLRAYRPYADAQAAELRKLNGKQTHKVGPWTPRQIAIIRYIAKKKPKATIKEIAAEARKVALGQRGGPLTDPEFVGYIDAPMLDPDLHGSYEDPELARDLQEPLDDAIRKRIERAKKPPRTPWTV